MTHPEITAMLAAATPGPWFVRYCDDEHHMCMTAISAKQVPPRNEDQYDDRDPNDMVAIVFHQSAPFVGPENPDCGDANATLIANAPTIIAGLLAEVRELRRAREWQPMEKVPKGVSVLLLASFGLIYCGQKRYGVLGEPSQDALEWRCDSSGRFATPIGWQPLPPARLVPDDALRGGT